MKQFPGEKVEDLYLHLVTKRVSLVEELGFTHGDYSLPNVLIHNGKINGFIDVGNSGIADIYQDLAIATKSIIRNYGKEWVSSFSKRMALTRSTTTRSDIISCWNGLSSHKISEVNVGLRTEAL